MSSATRSRRRSTRTLTSRCRTPSPRRSRSSLLFPWRWDAAAPSPPPRAPSPLRQSRPSRRHPRRSIAVAPPRIVPPRIASPRIERLSSCSSGSSTLRGNGCRAQSSRARTSPWCGALSAGRVRRGLPRLWPWPRSERGYRRRLTKRHWRPRRARQRRCSPKLARVSPRCSSRPRHCKRASTISRRSSPSRHGCAPRRLPS